MPIGNTTGTNKLSYKQSVRMAVLEVPFANATASSGAATANGGAGLITTDTVTTVAGGTYSLTVTNNYVTVGDIVGCDVTNGTNTTGTPSITYYTASAGAFSCVVQNVHASAAFGGTLKVGFQVIKSAPAQL